MRNRRDSTSQCAFCKRPEAVAGRLIANPSDYERACICDECIRVCLDAIKQSVSSSAERCSFCHKPRGTVKLVSSSGEPPNGTICGECLTVCMRGR